jgi:hypothetical protein
MNQPESIESLLESLLGRLGVPAPSTFNQLAQTWKELAGEPWASQSTPLYIRQKELVVEASASGFVSMLRYGVGDLMRRLDETLGAGLVESVRVVPPGRV